MNLPPVVYSLAFWKTLTFALAGLLALLGYFDVVPDNFVITAEALLAGALAILNALGINPELRVKLLEQKLKRAEQLLEESAIVRNDLLAMRGAKQAEKSLLRRK